MLRIVSVVALLGAFGAAIWAAGAETADVRDVRAGLFGVLLGVGLVLRAALRIRDGDVRLRSTLVRREEKPWSFAVGIAMLLGPGVLMLLGGAYWLLSAG